MKNIALILISGFLMASCASTKETKSTRAEKKAAEAEMVKRAVESRKYVIKMDKILVQGAGMVDLIPKANFFIMNGEIASVSLAYLGKTYFIRPITGINFNGQTTRYEMQSNGEKGIYNLHIEIETSGNKFDFYLNIGTSGSCDVSVTNPHIQSVSYRGTLVPLIQTEGPTEVQKEKI
jgi:Domain of unknown function (DUF4251)